MLRINKKPHKQWTYNYDELPNTTPNYVFIFSALIRTAFTTQYNINIKINYNNYYLIKTICRVFDKSKYF